MNLKIFYGSQTGNAQDIAEKMYRYSLNLPFKYCKSSIQEMNYFSLMDISKEDCLIFICSTTGQGDIPENMKLFWNKIMKRSFPNLNNYNVAVFGLGDSKYKYYNFVAKKLFRRLMQLKANILIPLGLADDQHPFGIDGEFFPWVKILWESLSEKLIKYIDTSNLFEECTSSLNFMKYGICVINSNVTHDMSISNGYTKVFLKSNNRETSYDHFQETRFLTFYRNDLSYDIGDTLSIFPTNSERNIEMFFKLTKLDKYTVFSIQLLDVSYSVPDNFPRTPISVHQLVKYCFDLNCTPRKSFFEMLAYFSINPIEKERLTELSSPNNLDDLYSYCFSPKRSIIEILQDFPSTSMDMHLIHWINIMPFIRPREYSIASSPITHVSDICILVAVVKFKTKIRNERIGLCSTFLSKLKINDFIFAKIKSGTLIFPNDDKPIVLISPGTGIAAFRGFIYERTSKELLSETLLCFGCRFKNKDFYFSNELLKLKEEGKLKLVTAFSREENCYIQDKLKQYSEFIFKMIMNLSGYIFVCGRSVDMPQQINEEIKMILIKEGQMSDKQACDILFNMEKLKRYQIETWS